MTCNPLVAVVALVASPMAAQQVGKADTIIIDHSVMSRLSAQTEGAVMREMAPTMNKVMGDAPEQLLTRRQALGLSTDQVSRLKQLQEGSKTAHDAAIAEAQSHLKEMEQAAGAPKPDTSAFRVHFEAAHNALEKARWALLASATQARALLTDAQLAKDARFLAATHSHIFCFVDKKFGAVACVCGTCEGFDHHVGEKCTWTIC